MLATDNKHYWRTDRPVTAPAPAAVPVTDGYYVVDGAVFKVQTAKSSGNQYAKKLNAEGRFDYAPGAIRGIRPEHAVTLEQAREWGRINGRCLICGAELTHPDSIEYGIGPVCRKRLA